MICSSTRVKLINLTSQEFQTLNLDELFRKYVEHVEFFDDGSAMLDLVHSKLDLHIQDWCGWTELLNVVKLPCDENDTVWCTLRVLDSNGEIITSVRGTDDELYPIYNPSQTKSGFHGEVRFLYDLKDVYHIRTKSEGHHLRVRNLTGPEDDMPIQFTSNLQLHFQYGAPVDHGYEIITKSGFYNGNDIHLVSADMAQSGVNGSSYK